MKIELWHSAVIFKRDASYAMVDGPRRTYGVRVQHAGPPWWIPQTLRLVDRYEGDRDRVIYSVGIGWLWFTLEFFWTER